jgi:hypothetical protein
MTGNSITAPRVFTDLTLGLSYGSAGRAGASEKVLVPPIRTGLRNTEGRRIVI